MPSHRNVPVSSNVRFLMAPPLAIEICQMQKLTAILILAASAQLSNAATFAELLTNSAQWTKFDWKDASQTSIWQDQEFKPYDSPSRSLIDDQFYKNRKAQLDGKTYNVSLVKAPLQQDFPDYIVAATDLETLTCDQVAAFWNKQLGQHSLKMDNSYKVLENYVLGEILYIWPLGSTSAIGKCSTVGSTTIRNFAIKFQSSIFPHPEAPIHLNCSRKLIRSGESATQTASGPMAITVIPSREIVTDAGGQLLISKVKTTYAAIEWTITTDTLVQKIRVDRTNGTLTGSAAMLKDNEAVGLYEGLCEKRTPFERRF